MKDCLIQFFLLTFWTEEGRVVCCCLFFPDLSEEKNYSYFFSVVRILAVATVYGKSVLHHLVDEVRYELRLTALNSFCFWQT